MFVLIKSRRDGYHIALQEIERAVCLSVCLSVCPTPQGSQTTNVVGLNLTFNGSPWTGDGFRPKKMQNFLKLNFWRIFKVLNRLYCNRMENQRVHSSLINIELCGLPLETCLWSFELFLKLNDIWSFYILKTLCIVVGNQV